MKMPDIKSDEVKKGMIEGFAEFIEKYFGGSDKHTEPKEKITKAVDDEQRLALFVVLEPNVADAHGDIYDDFEVEKACHSFNSFCNKAYLYHKVETEDAIILESYISPSSFTLDNGQDILKGTWLQLWSFPETEIGEEIWKNVKSGEFSGVSIGARAKVQNID